MNPKIDKPVYSIPGLEVEADGTILLIRCPKCGRENYAFNVTTGICTWCGYNAHEDPEITSKIKQLQTDK